MTHELALKEVPTAYPNRQLTMLDFARFADIMLFSHADGRWCGHVTIGAGGAKIELKHWGTSPTDVWENINIKFWGWVDGIG